MISILKPFFDGLLEPGFERKEVQELSSVLLAYIGDAVYELYVRLTELSHEPEKIEALHKRVVDKVRARSQADIVRRLYDSLSEEEKRVVIRGRNAKSGSVPRSAGVMDYKYSTGFEALIGYLYLTGSYERLSEILRMAKDIDLKSEQE